MDVTLNNTANEPICKLASSGHEWKLFLNLLLKVHAKRSTWPAGIQQCLTSIAGREMRHLLRPKRGDDLPPFDTIQFVNPQILRPECLD